MQFFTIGNAHRIIFLRCQSAFPIHARDLVREYYSRKKYFIFSGFFWVQAAFPIIRGSFGAPLGNAHYKWDELSGEKMASYLANNWADRKWSFYRITACSKGKRISTITSQQSLSCWTPCFSLYTTFKLMTTIRLQYNESGPLTILYPLYGLCFTFLEK